MLLKTILNSIEKHKGLVYKEIKFNGESANLILEVLIEPRRKSRGVCGRCGNLSSGYNTWAVGKHRSTRRYAWFLSRWTKRLSWQETAEAFGTSWHHGYRSVEVAVNWGLKHRSLEGVRSIGVDEIAWRKGHKYQTLAYKM